MSKTTTPFRRSPLARLGALGLLALSASVAIVACGSDNDASTNSGNGNLGGKSGKGGTGGKGGSSAGGGDAGGSAGSAGTGINPQGGTNAGGGNQGGNNQGGNNQGGNNQGGNGQSGNAGSSAGGECAGPPGPIQRTCRPPTDNECDGAAPAGFKPEGPEGNGFDDDCDGLVDEGCACPGPGATKDCYLLPSTQTNGDPQWQPQGWCAANSKGKVECKVTGSGEFKQLKYTGECIGAQGPKEEICENGDFNCDGADGNAANICECQPIICPDPIYTTPFPDPNNIGQFSNVPNGPKTISGIDGASWFKDSALAGKATNWRWTMVGGPCDDILPNPTFAIFPSNVGTPDVWSTHLGLKTLSLPKIPDENQPDPTFSANIADKFHRGWVLQGGSTPNKIFPAFSLSGDYYVTGKFQYPDPAKPDQFKEGQCTQVVKVRAPGLRVELCWPEVGANKDDNDVDLHLARLQGNTNGDGKHGWFTTAGNAPDADDCYYSPNSACGNRYNNNGSSVTPGWYLDEISDEPGGVGVCHGWGSRRFDGSVAGTTARPCTSPRLDRDNISCDPTQENPNAPEQDPKQQGDVASGNFCGPENINLDGKVLTQGQRFAVGVQCYNCVQGQNGSGKPAHPRVNIYCDGELKLGFGYDPSLPDGSAQTPELLTEGQTYQGSFWNVATVTWNNDPNNPCSINAVAAGDEWDDNDWRKQSNGSPFLCVQNGPLDGSGANPAPPPINTINWKFNTSGDYPDPSNPDAICAYLPPPPRHPCAPFSRSALLFAGSSFSA